MAPAVELVGAITPSTKQNNATVVQQSINQSSVNEDRTKSELHCQSLEAKENFNTFMITQPKFGQAPKITIIRTLMKVREHRTLGP